MTFSARLLSCCLALGLLTLLTTCEKDTLPQEESPFDRTAVDTRDDHIPDILCGDLCTDNLFDFDDLEPESVISEYQGVQITAFGLVGTVPDIDLGDPTTVRVFDTDRTLEEALEQDCQGFNDDDLLFPGGPFGNVLVIQEVPIGNPADDCANDAKNGGIVDVDFSALGTVTITCLTVFDTEEVGVIEDLGPVSGAILLFGADGLRMGDPIPIPGVEDGGAAVVPINTSGISRMDVVLLGSGAVSSICTRVDLPECPAEAEVLTFDELPENVPVMSAEGVAISGYPTPAIPFNTVSPTMCSDFDDDDMVLVPPIDGLPPAFGFLNVLTNQHRSKTDCANADPRGGTITFEFPTISDINSMAFIDTEEKGFVSYYGPGDVYLGSDPIPITDDGGYAFLTTEAEGVAKMVVDFGGSGGIDYVCYVPSEVPVEPALYDGCTYDYKWWKKRPGQACIDLDQEVFCGWTYRDILQTKARGRDRYFLAQEYVTALLNVTCNGAPFELIEDAWVAAGELLDDCGGVGPEAKELILQLQHFNQGQVGPGLCD